ncbi:MAG: DUF5916 domain-containing protein [Verrucomicrobia bacterium]|nr:DUF5916 domain-containing protein [Verrucomicrobiota bacterium]
MILFCPELPRSLPCDIRLVSGILWAGLFVPNVFATSYESSGNADTEVRTVEVTVTTERIVIDGVLDESIWKTAPKIGDLIQKQPDTGQPPSERTEAILLHDADNLYIGVIAYDSEPDKIIGTNMARDIALRSEDSLEIVLDTFRDKRNGYYFATTPAGSFVDGLVYGTNLLNLDWNAIWDVRTQRTDQGWVAEIAIPFKSLTFPENQDVWGFNISRKIYRKLEEDFWSSPRLETLILQVSEAGEISNMKGLNQGIGLDVRPFVASSWLHNKATGSDDFEFEPGLDVFYNITPSLKLTGTINTDFGETEVDERVVNLTRFSLFFPEKRSFFLEDVGVFNFASAGPDPPRGGPGAGEADIFPFFSRRIGLLDGQEVPLEIGAKLTGKVGSMDIGFLGVRTGDTSFVEGKNFFVGRFKQDLFEQSYVGGIITHGNPAPGLSSKTYGADVRLATSEFLGTHSNFIFNAYGLKSENEGVSGDDMSFGFSANYPNEIWEGMLVFREIQKNFDPSLGFAQRNNVRMYRVGGTYNPRPNDFFDLEQMLHDVFYTRFDNLEHGQLESSELYISWLDWHFNSGDGIHSFFDYFGGVERLFEPFEISPGVVLPVGKYTTDRYKISFGTARKRRLVTSIRVTWGDFWSGSAEEISARLTYKMPPWFTWETEIRQTFAHLPQGDFTARVISSSIDFAISPRLTFSNLAQYDNRSRNLGWQSRMRWTLKPGNDLFLSFNQSWINDTPNSTLRFIPQDTKIATKFQYTFRF